MNLTNAGIHFGKTGAFFFAMRNTNRAKFDYIMSFDKHPVNAVNKYVAQLESMISELQDFYFELQETKSTSGFMYKYNLNNLSGRGSTEMSQVLFGLTEEPLNISFSKYKRIKAMYAAMIIEKDERKDIKVVESKGIGSHWTKDELAIIKDTTLNATEKRARLNRTHSAVSRKLVEFNKGQL